MPDQLVEGGGSGDYPSDLEGRVSRVEGEVSDVRAVLGRLEAAFVRLDAKMDLSTARLEAKFDGLQSSFDGLQSTFVATIPHLATKEQVASLAHLATKEQVAKLPTRGIHVGGRGRTGDLHLRGVWGEPGGVFRFALSRRPSGRLQTGRSGQEQTNREQELSERIRVYSGLADGAALNNGYVSLAEFPALVSTGGREFVWSQGFCEAEVLRCFATIAAPVAIRA